MKIQCEDAMKPPNPYASPATIDDEALKNVVSTPESFRQALLQGVKYGFKWGSVIGLGLGLFSCAGGVLAWIMTLRMQTKLPSDFSLFHFITMALWFYCFCCIIGIVSGMVISFVAYLARKATKIIRRG